MSAWDMGVTHDEPGRGVENELIFKNPGEASKKGGDRTLRVSHYCSAHLLKR